MHLLVSLSPGEPPANRVSEQRPFGAGRDSANEETETLLGLTDGCEILNDPRRLALGVIVEQPTYISRLERACEAREAMGLLGAASFLVPFPPLTARTV